MRLRSVAFFEILFETTNPNRGSPPSRGSHRRMHRNEEMLFPFLKTASNSLLFRSRCPETSMRRYHNPPPMLLSGRDSKHLAAARSPALQHITAVFRAHARQKTMRSCALPLFRLICPFWHTLQFSSPSIHSSLKSIDIHINKDENMGIIYDFHKTVNGSSTPTAGTYSLEMPLFPHAIHFLIPSALPFHFCV